LSHSLVPENREVLKVDIPVWEREPETIDELKRGIKRNISGFADLYSWRSRSIKFNPRKEGNAIEELVLASGVDCSSEKHVDPMLGYMINKKRKNRYSI
jgi:CRISPR system Cascade subunit CasA